MTTAPGKRIENGDISREEFAKFDRNNSWIFQRHVLQTLFSGGSGEHGGLEGNRGKSLPLINIASENWLVLTQSLNKPDYTYSWWIYQLGAWAFRDVFCKLYSVVALGAWGLEGNRGKSWPLINICSASEDWLVLTQTLNRSDYMYIFMMVMNRGLTGIENNKIC